MSIELEQTPLAPKIAALLAGLRLRIRGYVWAHGVAAVVVVLGLAFWLSLAFDWLFEPPWQFRAVLLLAAVGAVAYVANRLILHRAFRPLDDTNLAVLVERRFRDYRDSLLTTVELSQQRSHAADFNPEMLDRTRRQAADLSHGVQLGQLFRLAPLARAAGLATVLMASVLLFAVAAPEAFGIWVQRVVLLDRILLWPRANHVRVDGFSDGRTMKVAKGSDVEIVAVADLTGRFRLPEMVQVRYRTGEGTQGRDNMSTIGTAGPRDREQKYSYRFKGVTSPIEFDIFGGDDRDRGYRIEVVDSPTIGHMDLECEYPTYTGRPANTVPASGLVQLPQGTKVTIHCEANKDLIEVPVMLLAQDKATPLVDVKLDADVDDKRHFSVTITELMADSTILFDLHDADGIRSRDPVRLVLAARPDDVPQLSLRLHGISTAITPEVRLPMVGDVHDDYGLTRLWLEYQIDRPKPKTTESGNAARAAALMTQQLNTTLLGRDDRPLREVEVQPRDGEALDLKRQTAVGELLRRYGVKTPEDLARIASADERTLAEEIKTQQQIDQALTVSPQVGDRLLLAAKAADNCALPMGANIGQGERYQIDIVAPEQLLSMLEGRELMLRRQFEVTYQEMIDTRDALTRLDFAPPDIRKPRDEKTGREPGDDKSDPGSDNGERASESPQAKAKRTLELRDLRVARALDNGDRAAHETLTVADSFDEIREEMTNNRIDTPELQTRLKDQIAEPLRQISSQRFPQWRLRLLQLRGVLNDPAAGAEKLKVALAQADAIIVEMKQVLDKMLELETFNEVVDMLRGIISDQEKVNAETKRRQAEELKNKLRELNN